MGLETVEGLPPEILSLPHEGKEENSTYLTPQLLTAQISTGDTTSILKASRARQLLLCTNYPAVTWQ